MRKLFLFVMLAILIGPFQAAAQEPNDSARVETEKQQYEKVNQEYGLKSVLIIPEGIEPIKVNSPEELENYIIKLQKQPTITTVQDEKSEQPSGDPTRAGNTYNTIRRSCSVSAGAPTVYVTADIRVGLNGSARWIDSASSRVSWSGVTFGLGISGQWSNTYPTSTKVDVRGGATIDIYLISEIGGIVLYSTPLECSFTYSVY